MNKLCVCLLVLLSLIGGGCYQSKIDFEEVATGKYVTKSSEPVPNLAIEQSVTGIITSARLEYGHYNAIIDKGKMSVGRVIVVGGNNINVPNGTITVDNITVNGVFYEVVNGVTQSFAIVRIGSEYSVLYKPEMSENVNTYEVRKIETPKYEYKEVGK